MDDGTQGLTGVDLFIAQQWLTGYKVVDDL
jgi:hypothetical protein